MSAFVPEIEVQQVVEFLTRELSNIDQKKAVQRGLMAAARIFVARGKLNLHARLMGHGGVGNLMRAARTLWRQASVTAYAGFRWTERIKSRAVWGNHAHLVDLGSGPRYTESGAYRGIMPANYFWTDARISEESKAADAIYDGVQQAINQMQAKLG